MPTFYALKAFHALIFGWTAQAHMITFTAIITMRDFTRKLPSLTVVHCLFLFTFALIAASLIWFRRFRYTECTAILNASKNPSAVANRWMRA